MARMTAKMIPTNSLRGANILDSQCRSFECKYIDIARLSDGDEATERDFVVHFSRLLLKLVRLPRQLNGLICETGGVASAAIKAANRRWGSGFAAGGWATGLCLIGLAITTSCQAQQATPERLLGRGSDTDTQALNCNSLLSSLASDLRQMRVEVIDLRIEVQRQTIAKLEQQLREMQEEHGRRQNDERVHQAQVAELDQLLSVHRGDQDERTQLEALRSTLYETTVKDVRAAVAVISQKESELSARLQAEKEKLAALSKRAKNQ
jgi:hypothetical protein